MSAIEQKIDDLYALPLSDFTAARNALAKSLTGDDRARVKQLEKPSVVAWAVNRLYWVERRTFDRLLAAGRALRVAQIAALEGRAADLREATASHRQALSDAVSATLRLVDAATPRPAAEPLSRMLEALSLAPKLPGAPGRFTEAVQPAGFEALAGITPDARAIAPRPEKPRPAVPPAGLRQARPVDAAAERRRAQADAAARKAAEAAHADARRDLDQARADLQRAATRADAARRQLAQAETALADSQGKVEAAEREMARTETALKAATSPAARQKR
ncbi:MAG TPA: hypothetical protein VM032_15800 [Vicinamibacterales bacterium]|nr:hypothetical protein [Vicinamibacterales bacterium]